MNKLLATCVGLLTASMLFGQTFSTDSIGIGKERSSEWEMYLDEPEFSIEYRFVNCDPPMGYDTEMILLKITNKGRNLLSFNWHMVLYYGTECKTCNYFDEYNYIVNINPESTEEGDCDMYSDYRMKIFSRFIDANYSQGEELHSFQLDNLTVSSVTID